MNSLACVQGINSMLYKISHSLYCKLINVHSSQQVPNDNLAKPPRLISSYRHLDKPKMNSTFIFIRILILIISILSKSKATLPEIRNGTYILRSVRCSFRPPPPYPLPPLLLEVIQLEAPSAGFGTEPRPKTHLLAEMYDLRHLTTVCVPRSRWGGGVKAIQTQEGGIFSQG